MGKKMTVQDHIAELRRRLIYIISFFIVTLVGGFFLAEPIIIYLQPLSLLVYLQRLLFCINFGLLFRQAYMRKNGKLR